MSEIHRKPASHTVSHHSQQDFDAEGPEPFAAPKDRQTHFANDAKSFFLCLWFVVSQSVMPVELFVYLAEQNALS